jgi:excisionase family DNA binding protein
VTLDEAAAALAVSPSTILRMLREGTLPGQQLCKGAPWIIRLQDLECKGVRNESALATPVVSRAWPENP